jgi:TolB-like protein
VSRFPPLLVALLLVPVVARAQSSSEEPPAAPLVVVLLPLEANEDARDEAPGLTALLVSRLAESPRLVVSSRADQEAVRTAGVCTQGPCLEAPPGSPGSSKARYIVSGRLDRFGSRYLLTSSLVDSESGRALLRPRVEVSAVDSLPHAAVSLADELLAALVQDPSARPSSPAPSVSARPREGSFFLGVRFNNSLISNFASFNPGGDVEFGFLFHPEWMAFAQVGFTYVRAEEEGHEGGLNVLPSVLGLRHYHNAEGSFRPYWGFGLGVQLSFGEYGIFQQTGPLPTVIGFAGLEYLIAGHLGLQLEASTNIAQATLGLSDGGLGSGLNLDLNAGIAWHF